MVVGALCGRVGVVGVEFDVGDEAVAGALCGEEGEVDQGRECVCTERVEGRRCRSDKFLISKRSTLTLHFKPQALRKLNSVTVPKVVSVPKTDEEDAQRGNQ